MMTVSARVTDSMPVLFPETARACWVDLPDGRRPGIAGTVAPIAGRHRGEPAAA